MGMLNCDVQLPRPKYIVGHILFYVCIDMHDIQFLNKLKKNTTCFYFVR